MLRKIRITAAAVFFTVITLLLLDFTGTLHAWFGWMARVQLLPAVSRNNRLLFWLRKGQIRWLFFLGLFRLAVFMF